MPRRKPVAHDSGSGQPITVETDDIAELLSQAKVPQNARPACIEEITQLFDWYNSTIAGGKCRGLFGEAAAPFEARLETRDGAAFWTMRNIEDITLARAQILFSEGATIRDEAAEMHQREGDCKGAKSHPNS